MSWRASRCYGSITGTLFLQALSKLFCCCEWVGMLDIFCEDLDIEVGEDLAVGNLLVAIRLDECDGTRSCVSFFLGYSEPFMYTRHSVGRIGTVKGGRDCWHCGTLCPRA